MINEQSQYFMQKESQIRYSEKDFNQVLKPSALFNFLQDVATNAADDGGFGYDEIVTNNLAWFLLKYHMEFNNYPQNIDEILIKTESRGVNRLFAQRDFDIYTKSNELIGRVISHWALVNFNDKSMIPPNTIFPQIGKVEKREDDLSFNKVHEPERIDYTEDFKIRFDDIDVNQHVNNANYIVWAFEALPKEFRAKYKLKTLDMVYKKEVQYGNVIVSQVQIDDTLTKHVVKNKTTGEDLCVINAEFINL